MPYVAVPHAKRGPISHAPAPGQDGNRVRFFKDDALDIGLPERLVAPSSEWDVYLDERFRYTLLVRVIGGDIHSFGEDGEKTIHFQDEYMRHGRKPKNLEDEIWQRELGQEALGWICERDLDLQERLRKGSADQDDEH